MIDEPDDAIAVGAVATLLADIRPEVVHNHMYRAEIVGHEGRRSRWARPATPPVGRGDRPLEPHPLARGPRGPAAPHAAHGPPHRGEPGDGAQDRRGAPASDVPVSLIYNGVDLVRYDHTDPCCTLREEYGMPPEAQIVGVVARLEHEKGHPTLLDAWPRRAAPRARTPGCWCGRGKPASRARGPGAPLSGVRAAVIFTGRRDDVPAVTAALDVAVLPSYREAQGLTILEAMALSRPVVASAVGGIPEMIEDGRTGLLVPPHDPAALAAAIIRLLADHAYADMLARGGHDLVHERFCIELMVDAVEEIYDEGARAVRPAELVAAAV